MTEIFTGKTVEEAKAAAAEKFGADEEKIEFEIIQEPKKGLFGKTKGEAKVKATLEMTAGMICVSYLKAVLKEMGIESGLTLSEDEAVRINIESEDIGTIIGRRGDTLDALQYLCSMVCNRAGGDYKRITVDCNGYREKRKKTLEELAEKISKSCLRTGRTSVLEPMNPYERRIIHSAVSEIEGVTSRSTGEEPYRKVVISPLNKRPEKRGHNGGGYKKNPGRKNSRPSQNTDGPRSLDLKTSFEKDYKRPKPEDTINTGLYGKIEF